MPNRYSKFIPFISVAGDLLILNILFVAGFRLLFHSVNWLDWHYLAFYAYLNLVWFILENVFDSRDAERNSKKAALLYNYVKIIVFFFFFFLLFFQVYPLSYYPRPLIKYLFPVFFTCLFGWKMVIYYSFFLYRKLGFNFRTVVILGHTPASAELSAFFLHNQWHGYRFLGFFDETATGLHVLGSYNDLKLFFEKNHVDEVYISWDGIPGFRMDEITEILSDYPVQLRIVPDLGKFSFKSAELVDYGRLPVIRIHQGPLSYWYNKLLKRMLDIGISLVVIFGVLWWMTIILYIISLFQSQGGLFFRQRRTRVDGKEFWCLKFRSMYKNAEENTRQAARDDQRITAVGKYLRKFSLDEMPQFINVLLGQMSVVGPRPHMLLHTEEYRRLIRSFMLRHTVKPGITGLAQVQGYRGEIRKYEDLKKRVEFDVRYIENWTFNMDIKIILLTLWVVIRGQEQAN